MVTKLMSALVALVLIVSTVALGQDAKKAATKEASKEMGPVKVFSCGAPCNFKVHSRDEQEVVDATIAHAKKHHNMTMSSSDVKAKITVEGEGEKSTEKKEKPKG